MTPSKTTNRVTKKDLVERDAQIEGFRAEKEQLQEEIAARIARTEELEDTLAQAQTAINYAVTETANALDEVVEVGQFYRDVEDDLGSTIETLFSRLQFATMGLTSITAYRGDDVAIVHALVDAVLADLLPFVANGTEDEAFVADNAVADAAYWVASRVPDQSSDDAATNQGRCGCGGGC